MAERALQSSNLRSMDYDVDTQVLRITFHSGRTYEYGSVPQTIADGLAESDSPGRYFNANIKDSYSPR